MTNILQGTQFTIDLEGLATIAKGEKLMYVDVNGWKHTITFTYKCGAQSVICFSTSEERDENYSKYVKFWEAYNIDSKNPKNSALSEPRTQ